MHDCDLLSRRRSGRNRCVSRLRPRKTRQRASAYQQIGELMTSYGHPLVFGTLLEPSGAEPQKVVRLAEFTEECGLDLVTLADHPYWTQRLDTMTLLAVIAARTARVTIAPNLANLPLRSPITLARTAATLDVLTGGRFELGIGAGAQALWDQIVADGGPRRSAGESIAALEEAVQIVRRLWHDSDPVQINGKFYTLRDTPPGPTPVHDMGIWLGAYQPRMLSVVGRLADGWVSTSTFLPPEHLSAANDLIDAAAISAGRSPTAIRRLYNIEGSFGADGGFLQGSPTLWAEQLAELVFTEGISGFILFRVDSTDTIRRFAAEVVPAVRELTGNDCID